MQKIKEWQSHKSGNLSKTIESSQSTIWVLSARKLEVKYFAIYSEKSLPD